jgi:magnesium-transporting ATPase (P-type)
MSIRAYLEPIADWFGSLGVPEPIVHWGHPVMMGIVVVVMGSFVAWAGWQGRMATDPEVAAKNRADHRKIAPWMFLFITLGYTGGVLSLVMQGQPIFESGHFWTGSFVVALLSINGLLSYGFGVNKSLRTVHAYLGTAVMGLLIVHAVLGLQLGLSI